MVELTKDTLVRDLYPQNLAYVDLDDGELMHWKYVYKKRVNGKWRYYYDSDKLKDDLGVDERQNYKKAQEKYAIAKNKEYDSKNNLDYTKNLASEMERKNGSGGKRAGEIIVADARKDWVFDVRMSSAYGKSYVKAKKEYMKTPLGSLLRASESVKRSVSRAKTFVSKLLKRK